MERDQAYWEERANRVDDKPVQEWYLIDFQRLRPILALTRALEPTASVLEAGCGTSSLVLDLAQHTAPSTAGEGASVGRLLAFDYSPACIRRQIERAAASGLASAAMQRRPEFLVMDARALPLADGAFDVVLDKSTLDAVDCSASAASACCASEYARVLRVGGYLCLVTCRPPRLRLREFAVLPFRLTRAQALKAPGEETAPGGCTVFLLERLPDGKTLDLGVLDRLDAAETQETAEGAVCLPTKTIVRECYKENEGEGDECGLFGALGEALGA